MIKNVIKSFIPLISKYKHFILQNAKKVIGIELCQEAVEDAKFNADINGK